MKSIILNLHWLAVFQLLLMIFLILMSKGNRQARIIYLLYATTIFFYVIKPLMYNQLSSLWLISFVDYTICFIPIILLRICIFTVTDGLNYPHWFRLLLLGNFMFHTLFIFSDAEQIDGVLSLFSSSIQFFCLALCTFLIYRLYLECKTEPKFKYRFYFNECLLLVSLLIFLHGKSMEYGLELIETLLSASNLVAIIATLIFFSVRLVLVEDVGYKTQLWIDKNINFNNSGYPEADDGVNLELKTSDDLQTQKFLKTVKSEKLYTKFDLKIDDLATGSGLSIPKCRKLIIGKLGYKNFSQFINYLRIIESKRIIRENPQRPFLSISLDVGFKSISAFNIAFRNEAGMTPTEYRVTHIYNRARPQHNSGTT
jgi:AraC-like DNA-binding protein